MFEKFKDRIKGFKNIMNETKKTRTIERTINKWIKKWNKKNVKYVRYILEKSDADLTTLITICKFFEKPEDYGCAEKERELKNISKKRINEIERLKEEVKSNEDKLFDGEKISKLLTDLKYEKHSSLNDIAVLESKLTKLEISPEWIDRIIMIESFYHFESKLTLKQYFNNKSLMVYVNQVLSDFPFMSVICNQ